MTIEVWENIHPIALTGEQVREALEWLRVHPAARHEEMEGSQLRLPEPEEVARTIHWEDLQTPLDAAHLNGYRLVRTEDPQAYAEIRRRDNQIVLRHIFHSEKHTIPHAVRDMPLTLTRQLLNDIHHRFLRFKWHPAFISGSERRLFEYSSALVKDLLIKTLVNTEPPDIFPSPTAPPPEELFKAAGELAGVKWEYASDYFLWVEKRGNEWVIKDRDERGHESVLATAPGLPEAFARLIHELYFTSPRSLFIPDSNFV